LHELVLAIAFSAAAYAEPAQAEDSVIYRAAYVEAMPNTVASAVTLLERYRAASRRENGNLSFLVLQEIARPNRFATLQIWADQAALEGHENAAGTVGFRDRFKAIESAPPDERTASIIHGVRVKSDPRSETIYVLTHVDVVPVNMDDCLALLSAMSADASKDHGNIAYELLRQKNRGNHFIVAEEWTSRKSLDEHIAAAHTRAFRDKLSPMLGALYDERFYSELH
jgi:quinol monooxygenase YgiN